jgi:hypothetical protein
MASQELETYAKYERYYNAGGVRTRCFEKGETESRCRPPHTECERDLFRRMTWQLPLSSVFR